MNQPVLAVTSIAALSYAVFNAMSALLQLIDGNRIGGGPVSIGDNPALAQNVRDMTGNDDETQGMVLTSLIVIAKPLISKSLLRFFR